MYFQPLGDQKVVYAFFSVNLFILGSQGRHWWNVISIDDSIGTAIVVSTHPFGRNLWKVAGPGVRLNSRILCSQKKYKEGCPSLREQLIKDYVLLNTKLSSALQRASLCVKKLINIVRKQKVHFACCACSGLSMGHQENKRCRLVDLYFFL